MNANQDWIDAIGNDIANVNTTGYKSTEVQFEDLLSQSLSGATPPSGTSTSTTTVGGINPTQVGLGVKVAGIETNFSAGSTEQTGNPLDLSIQGNGFFVVQGSGQTYYTQAGSLSLDANGDLVTPNGDLVQGWSANSAGAINSSAPLTTLSIPSNQQVPATPTSSITFGGNLAGQSGWTDPTSSSGSTSTPVGASTSVTVYTPNGSTETLDLSFQESSTSSSSGTSTGGSSWNVSYALVPTGTTPKASDWQSVSSPLTFDGTGTLTNTPPTLTVGSGASSITLNFGGVTANASAPTIAASNQNGAAPGSLQSYSIGTDGVIKGVFSNGQTLDLGQIALANFANPNGLLKVGNSNFAPTANSGLAQVGAAGNGNLGTIEAGTLEASNVDLATEMTNLIQAQNGFQANTSVIGTDQTILQDLVNLKTGA
jgi:flagellar hook protein FlgE